jgi:hypothetical protein
MGKKNKPEPPTTQPQPTGEQRPVTYVVVREGFRVSDREYVSPQDLAAIVECEFWNKVAVNHSYGEKVEIVQYDPKKHRVW